MMFEISYGNLGNFKKTTITNLETGEHVSIIPEFGANVCELVLKKDNLYSILDCDDSYGELKRNKWFKCAKLIPFPNRVENGQYSHNQKKYNLLINFPSQNHAIHGLLYNKKFNVKKIIAKKNLGSLELEYDGHNLKGYPFRFKVIVQYLLSSKGFKCSTCIKNTGTINIPVGDGWHPYFRTGTKIDELYIQLPKSKKILVDRNMIPTGKKLIYSKYIKPQKILKQNFDTGFHIMQKKGIATTNIIDKKQKIKIILWQEVGKNKYPFLQVFIPPKRRSIAIEPMTCNTNALNNKDGLILLRPNKRFKASYGVRLE